MPRKTLSAESFGLIDTIAIVDHVEELIFEMNISNGSWVAVHSLAWPVCKPAIIESMRTVRITEAELARDVRSVIEKVERGSEVIIERDDHQPVAVIRSSYRGGRPIEDILREATERNSTITLDPDFGDDLEAIIAGHQQLGTPPSWD